MQITKKDILWNYAATFLKIASGVLLLPLILRKMPSEMVGIWSVFMTITAFASILDFGFSTSFARNVTYVFSGVNELKTNGYQIVDIENKKIDYGLLKGLINAMKWFYSRISVLLFLFLTTFGTYYINYLLTNYKGNHYEVLTAWFLLCIITTYNIYTLYYDSLLQGKGLITKSKQIIIIGQALYLLLAMVLILIGYGIISIVFAQVLSVIIIRVLSYKIFYTNELKLKLKSVVGYSRKEILKSIYPNAVKIGLTSLGGFLVQKSSIIIGSLYVSLSDLATYGISSQLIMIIGGLASIYISTYQPKIAHLRIVQNKDEIKNLYLKGQLFLFATYFISGVVLLFCGSWALELIKSQTKIMTSMLLLVALIISFLENNHAIAGAILLSNNEVPFFKASLFAGGITILLLLIMFHFFEMHLWAMILAPGIAHLYNNWKWPYEVFKQLDISVKDFKITYNFNK